MTKSQTQTLNFVRTDKMRETLARLQFEKDLSRTGSDTTRVDRELVKRAMQGAPTLIRA